MMQRINNITKYFKVVFQLSPHEIFILLGKSLLDGIFPSVQMFLLAKLIDEVLHGADIGMFRLEMVFLLGGFFALAAYNWMT